MQFNPTRSRILKGMSSKIKADGEVVQTNQK